VTRILAGSPEPIPAGKLAEKVLASGYQTKSKDFLNAIWVGVGKMDKVENVPGKAIVSRRERQQPPRAKARLKARSRARPSLSSAAASALEIQVFRRLVAARNGYVGEEMSVAYAAAQLTIRKEGPFDRTALVNDKLGRYVLSQRLLRKQHSVENLIHVVAVFDTGLCK
jgi:hypothetical protein